jgi:indolepyruvate decarboxylase
MESIDHATTHNRTEAVGDFLSRRLRELCICHVFGVAGGFNLEFLEQLVRTEGLEWVDCCNELNAAYAADGYARTKGLSALVTTYGVGELGALYGVGWGAFRTSTSSSLSARRR